MKVCGFCCIHGEAIREGKEGEAHPQGTLRVQGRDELIRDLPLVGC